MLASMPKVRARPPHTPSRIRSFAAALEGDALARGLQRLLDCFAVGHALPDILGEGTIPAVAAQQKRANDDQHSGPEGDADHTPEALPEVGQDADVGEKEQKSDADQDPCRRADVSFAEVDDRWLLLASIRSTYRQQEPQQAIDQQPGATSDDRRQDPAQADEYGINVDVVADAAAYACQAAVAGVAIQRALYRCL